MFLKELRFIDQKVEESQFESFFTDGACKSKSLCALRYMNPYLRTTLAYRECP
jgi:hypothetical protein